MTRGSPQTSRTIRTTGRVPSLDGNPQRKYHKTEKVANNADSEPMGLSEVREESVRAENSGGPLAYRAAAQTNTQSFLAGSRFHVIEEESFKDVKEFSH